MKKMLKSTYGFLGRVARVAPNLRGIGGIIKAESYYPEVKRKGRLRRRFENVVWALKYDETNVFYNLYGLDVEGGHLPREYMPYKSFMDARNDKNLRVWANNYNYIALLRDKYLFERYLKSFGVRTANTIAVIKDGELFDRDIDNKIGEEVVFAAGEKRFVKSVDGECADGVTAVFGPEDFRRKRKNFGKGMYIVQEQLEQHPKMNRLNPSAVNTLRIITINSSGAVSVLAAIQRIGARKSGDVDNWAVGGLDVEVDKKTGILRGDGFYKPGYGTRIDRHPDTGVVFDGFEIPLWDEAVKLVKRAHSKMYGVHSIGWDVAITSDGPALIEGNDNYEISMVQINRGIRNEWKRANS